MADHARKGVAHHPAAGRGEHQEERAEQLGDQASPFLAGIVEVRDPLDELPLVVRNQTHRLCAGCGLRSAPAGGGVPIPKLRASCTAPGTHRTLRTARFPTERRRADICYLALLGGARVAARVTDRQGDGGEQRVAQIRWHGSGAPYPGCCAGPSAGDACCCLRAGRRPVFSTASGWRLVGAGSHRARWRKPHTTWRPRGSRAHDHGHRLDHRHGDRRGQSHRDRRHRSLRVHARPLTKKNQKKAKAPLTAPSPPPAAITR